MEERLAIVVSNIEELQAKLKDFCNAKVNIDKLYSGNTGINDSHLKNEHQRYCQLIV